MKAACLSFRSRVEGYLGDSLAREERREFRLHLRACPDCREIALEQDSTLIFGALPGPIPNDREAEREALAILENVRGAIAIRQAEQRISPLKASRPGRRYAAAGAMAACLAALLFFNPSVSPIPSGRRSTAARFPGSRATESARRILPPSAPAPEALAPASATIYEWNAGSGGETEPKIVWIVDRSFDI